MNGTLSLVMSLILLLVSAWLLLGPPVLALIRLRRGTLNPEAGARMAGSYLISMLLVRILWPAGTLLLVVWLLAAVLAGIAVWRVVAGGVSIGAGPASPAGTGPAGEGLAKASRLGGARRGLSRKTMVVLAVELVIILALAVRCFLNI
jgi:hypothetical protein